MVLTLFITDSRKRKKTPEFRKCRPLSLFKHIFIYRLTITILLGLSIPNPDFLELAFLVNGSAD
jgi:hypothetical protein